MPEPSYVLAGLRRWAAPSLELARSATRTHAAFISVTPNAPAVAGGGPLSKVPFAVKDNIYTRNLPTTGGSVVLERFRAPRDAPAVAALRDAGAWVVGKTNLHELALGVTSDNGAYGAVRNPLDPSRSAGGSSGGSAAAVALGVVPFALGTDTGGSMTIPAAACGVVGFRPSSGRYGSDGVIHISTTRDEVGVIARTVDEVIAVDGLIRRTAHPPGPPARIRLGVATVYLEDIDEETAAAVHAAFKRLREAGAELVFVEHGETVEAARASGLPLVRYELVRDLARFLTTDGVGLGIDIDALVCGTRSPDVRALLAGTLDEPVSPDDYRYARQERARLRACSAVLLTEAQVDALVYPTIPGLTPPVGGTVVRLPSGDGAVFPTLTRHTESGSLIGAPSVSIPIGRPDGPAVGLTLESAPGGDDALLALAAAVAALLNGAPAAKGYGDDRE